MQSARGLCLLPDCVLFAPSLNDERGGKTVVLIGCCRYETLELYL